MGAEVRNVVDTNIRHSRHVLHLEDQPEMTELVRVILERVNYDVESVSTCDAFFQRLARKSPDLFVLDMQLPDGNGLDVLRRLRATSQYDRIPALVLTAASSDEIAMNGFERGANAFLVKMPTAKRLIDTVDYLMAEVENDDAPLTA